YGGGGEFTLLHLDATPVSTVGGRPASQPHGAHASSGSRSQAVSEAGSKGVWPPVRHGTISGGDSRGISRVSPVFSPQACGRLNGSVIAPSGPCACVGRSGGRFQSDREGRLCPSPEDASQIAARRGIE